MQMWQGEAQSRCRWHCARERQRFVRVQIRRDLRGEGVASHVVCVVRCMMHVARIINALRCMFAWTAVGVTVRGHRAAHTPLVDQQGGDAVALTALIAKHDARAHGRDLPVLAPRGCPAVGRERAAGSTYASTIYAMTRTRHANNKQTNLQPYADPSRREPAAVPQVWAEAERRRGD